MIWIGAVLLGLMLVSPTGEARAQNDLSVGTMPPVVVKTVPQAGNTRVDPSTSEIRVTFSKDMMTDNMWSWVIHTKETFPEIAGEVRYLDDNRTCVAPVRLEPGKTYAIWFNSPSYQHSAFRDVHNNPAVPYLLVFETAPE